MTTSMTIQQAESGCASSSRTFLPRRTLEGSAHEQAIAYGRCTAAVLWSRRDGEGLDPGPDQDPLGATSELRGSGCVQHRLPARCSRKYPQRIESDEYFRLYGVWSAGDDCIFQSHTPTRHLPHRILAA